MLFSFLFISSEANFLAFQKQAQQEEVVWFSFWQKPVKSLNK
jgi:hypothetical protein